MKRILFLLPVLLAGCSGGHSGYYASRLKLPALAIPQTLASVPSTATADEEKLYTSITDAQSASQVEGVLLQLDMGTGLLSLFNFNTASPNDTPEVATAKNKWEKEFKLYTAYVDQAAQLKKAELEDGDTRDKSGEVADRIQNARQCSANAKKLNESIPAPR